MKQKSYKGRIVGLSLGLVFCVALLTFALVWFFGASYPAFFTASSREEAPIPGLKEGISPQGLCGIDSEEYPFAMSGYMVDKSASRVYLIGPNGTKYFTLKNSEGKEITTHFGGITSSEKYIWVASGSRMVAVGLSRALAAENGAALTVEYEFTTGIQNAFCYCVDKLLYAGEFYRAAGKAYKTDESHHLTVDGETNYAFVYEYVLNDEDEVSSTVPSRVISVREQVQGFAVTETNIYLSTSYGLADSYFFTYDNVLNAPASGTVNCNGTEVPLFRLDSKNLVKKTTGPCMSEEIFVKNDRIYVLFESLCNKYKLGTRYRVDEIISLSVNDLK